MIAKRITLDDILRPDGNVLLKIKNDLRVRIQHLCHVLGDVLEDVGGG